LKVKIEFFSTLRLDLKIKRAEYEVKDELTVEQLLHRLSMDISPTIYDKLVKNSKPIQGTNILINGKSFWHLKLLNTPLHDGDLIQIFPPAAGG
jgi:molybdopterin synthase sulfur carrier subunit